MDLSRLRQQLTETQHLLRQQLKVILAHRRMAPGSVYLLRRKCGKKRCRCNSGALHESWVYQVRSEGIQKSRIVPKGERERWKRLTSEHQDFRKAKRKLAALTSKMLELVDLIGEAKSISPPERHKK